MKIPNASNLAKVKMLIPIIPTLESETDGCELLIEMDDGTIGDYMNEGGLEFNEKHTTMKDFLKSTGLTMNEIIPSYDKKLTEAVKIVYPNVKKVYCLNL